MITTDNVGMPSHPVFPLRSVVSKEFPTPDFAMHYKEAWSLGNLDVQIGAIVKTGYPLVDEFNQLVMDIFNFDSGNMLLKGMF